MDWEQYAALYPDGPDESGYERLRWEARRIVERAVTGADGVNKLSAAPPTQPEAAQAVERCQAALVHLLWRQERAESWVEHPGGGVSGGVVTAVTAGNESVSYAAPSAGPERGREQIRKTVERYLAGVPDGNGVNLLYAGRYPMKVG